MGIALQNVWNELQCVGYSHNCQPFHELCYMRGFVAVLCNGPPYLVSILVTVTDPEIVTLLCLFL
jgi:hypothetical protein